MPPLDPSIRKETLPAVVEFLGKRREGQRTMFGKCTCLHHGLAADLGMAGIGQPQGRRSNIRYRGQPGKDMLRPRSALGKWVTRRINSRIDDMRRREFITLFGGAVAAGPLTARAQQPPMPVIGYLGAESPAAFASRVRAFRQGLGEAGYAEGRNAAIEFRWAEGQHNRLPALAADLVGRQVAVIIAPGGAPAALAAKSATTTIPIVFEMGADPIAMGLVGSLSRPGGNLTGVTSLSVEVTPKRLEFLHELIPTAGVVAVLVNPTSPTADSQSRNLQALARARGLRLHVLQASSEREFDTVFATLPQLRAAGLVVASDTLFGTHGEQLAALAVRHAVPAIHQSRDFTIAGGLMSYGGSFVESHRQAGIYTGRIIKGGKPADLPVQQVTKVEFFINLKAAKTLGVTFPPSLLARADQVIE